MTIHRIISWFLIILIIAPLHISMCTIRLVFNIFNQFHYINFWKIEVPQSIYQITQGANGTETISRIIIIFYWSCREFIKDIKQLTTCKF